MPNKLTDDQQRIVDTLDRPLFVAAGAGAGKSSTLAERVCQAFLPGPDGEPPYLESLDQVLVITFTHAAADEIKEKIRARLREAGLTRQALQVDSAWISTIHGMCSRILRRHALDLGIDPQFALIGDTDASNASEAVIDQALTQIREDRLYPELRRAFDLRGSMGTNDRGTVFGMVDSLRDATSSAVAGFDSVSFPGTDPDLWADLRRLRDAYASLLNTGCAEKSYKSASGQQSQEELEASLQSLEEALLMPPGQRTADAAREALARVAKPNRRVGNKTYKAVAADAASCLTACALDVSLAQMGPLAGDLLQIARSVDDGYRQRKFKEGVLDNDDLLSLTLKAFREHPEIAAEYSDRFKLVMVDEFQDTNAQQVRMIELLSGPDACHLCTVGDAQQSIYRFRAADVRVFSDREEKLKAADAPDATGPRSLVRLKKNFRSHADVLKLVEKLLGDGLMPGFMTLEPNTERPDGLKAQGMPRADFEIVSTGYRGANSAERTAVAAEMVAQRIAECVAAGQDAGDAVLLLGRMSNAAVYMDAIRRHGLDCVVSGGSTFSRAEEVGLVASMLHLLACPKDTDRGMFPLLESDLFRLDGDDLCLLGTKVQAANDAYAKRPIDTGLLGFDLPGGVQPSARLVAAHEVLCRALSRVGSWRIQDILIGIMRESGWLARLEAQGAEGLAKAANALAAARFVAELADEHSMGPARAAEEFDHWLQVSKEGPKSLVGGSSSAVRVMTIHASKGLEFPVVAIADCWDAASASGSAGITSVNRGGAVLATLVPGDVDRKELIAQAPDTEEECKTHADWAGYLLRDDIEGDFAESVRLLYVAITRAREAVILAMPVALSKEKRGTRLQEGVLDALVGMGEMPQVGESFVEYGGSAPCRIRRVSLMVDKGDEDGSDTTDKKPEDGQSEDKKPQRSLVLDSVGTFAMDDSQDAGGDAEDACFDLYDQAVADGLAFGLGKAEPWLSREDVFSYSSAHARMWEAHAGDFATGSVGTGSTTSAIGETAGSANRASSPSGAEPSKLPKVVIADGDDTESSESAPLLDDADKATNLGSAFHELAQVLVETGRDLTPDKIQASERYWHLSKRACGRLEAALGRWQGSRLREEALSHRQIRAEVPFFSKVAADYGSYVEGAIDLLATDSGSESALVVDYKTGDAGLSLEQVHARHVMQANFYAYVLMQQGFAEVRCAFVCVERDAAEVGGEPGQPVVVTYAFDGDNQPEI